MGHPSLIKAKGLEDFFYHQVRHAFSNQKIVAHPHTEFYLVRLLSDFCHINRLHNNEDGKEVPLAIRYLESLQADYTEGFRLLKHLGDFSLYIAGFFQDSLNRRNIDLDYYISMGGSAYHRLHFMIQSSKYGDTFRETFFELSAKFTKFMDALTEISESGKLSKNSDLLRLYEKYLSTGSERIRKRLNEFGIFPSRESTSDSTH